jgi:LysR family transcriptional regulator, positive regulator for ilvC
MDIRQLQQFVQLADTRHFGRASRLCHVSPSALSRSIQQLEARAGAVLFLRDNRSVALTPQGQTLLLWAREVLAGWDGVRRQLAAQSGVLQGEVSLYCSVTASHSFLHEILGRLRHSHPQIELKLHTGDPEHAVARILAGTEDMAIGARPDRLPAGVAFQPIARSRLVFIAAAGQRRSRDLTRRRPDPKAWSTETGLARQRTDRWFRDLGVVPRIYAQVAGNEAIVSMVGLGFGVGVVPQIVLESSPLAAQVEVLAVQPPLAPYEVGLLALEKRRRTPLVAAFWQAGASPQREN